MTRVWRDVKPRTLTKFSPRTNLVGNRRLTQWTHERSPRTKRANRFVDRHSSCGRPNVWDDHLSLLLCSLRFRDEFMRAIFGRRQIGQIFHPCSLCNPPRLGLIPRHPLARHRTGSRKANISHNPFSLLSKSSIENELTTRGRARSRSLAKDDVLLGALRGRRHPGSRF